MDTHDRLKRSRSFFGNEAHPNPSFRAEKGGLGPQNATRKALPQGLSTCRPKHPFVLGGGRSLESGPDEAKSPSSVQAGSQDSLKGSHCRRLQHYSCRSHWLRACSRPGSRPAGAGLPGRESCGRRPTASGTRWQSGRRCPRPLEQRRLLRSASGRGPLPCPTRQSSLQPVVMRPPARRRWWDALTSA